MITIKIGTAERRGGDIDAGWISGQVNARRKEGKKFCVFFKVNCGEVNLSLPSRDCPTAGGGEVEENLMLKKSFSWMNGERKDFWIKI